MLSSASQPLISAPVSNTTGMLAVANYKSEHDTRQNGMCNSITNQAALCAKKQMNRPLLPLRPEQPYPA
jgi:hypothetical protein